WWLPTLGRTTALIAAVAIAAGATSLTNRINDWLHYSSQKIPVYGYIDSTGKLVIKSQFYTMGFSDGLAAVLIYDKWGYIDKTGKMVIEPKFEYKPNIINQDFSEGLAAVGIKGKWGFIDKTGKIAIEPQFDYATRFFEGLSAVSIKGKWGFIDK